jgi:sugar/nucleoside kinase (ribokinase family)
MKRLGVLGTFVWDTIWTLEDAERGRPFTSWGGIAYSLAAAAAARPEGWEVVPLVKVGADLDAEARGFLAGLPGVAHASPSVRTTPEPTNRVELRYTDRDHRGERLTGGVPAWRFEELEPHLAGVDALYLNFISGFEMELETAERLRAAFAGPVYTDLHSLFLGCPGAGARVPRRLPEWERWAACFDAVQLNQDELGLLTDAGEGWTERAGRVLRQGPGLAAVTLGPGGAAVTTRAGFPEDPLAWPAARGAPPAGPRALSGAVYPAESRPVGDPTGAGDVWGVTFFSGLLGGLGIAGAARSAHRAAARKLGHRGASTLHAHLAAPAGG